MGVDTRRRTPYFLTTLKVSVWIGFGFKQLYLLATNKVLYENNPLFMITSSCIIFSFLLSVS